MLNNVKYSKGISIIEVVVSMAIVAYISFAVIAMVSQSSVFSRSIDTTYTASYIAQRRMDLLKRLGFDQLSFAAESAVKVGPDGNLDLSGEFIRTTEVYDDYGGNTNLKRVKVLVRRLRILAGGGKADDSVSDSFTQPIVIETLFSSVQ